MLASVVVPYVRKRKHSETRHNTVQHGTAPHRTAGHDNARHRTALRCVVELAKLSGAVLLFLCFQLAGCDLRKNGGGGNLSPHLLNAIRCTHVLSQPGAPDPGAPEPAARPPDLDFAGGSMRGVWWRLTG